MSSTAPQEVVIVGGGVAGLSAAVFTARHGLDTLVIDSGESILRRNAHLENFPGFPAGVNARNLLDLIGEQADQAGCERLDAEVTLIEESDEGFAVETENERIHTQYVVAATKNEVGYLEGIEGLGIVVRGKAYVDVDERGRTGVDGLYAAGRLAEKSHQAAVCAGHGTEVAITVLEDDDRPFYHDWVAPKGYFTDRDREIPPGCEEIDDEERHERESESLDVMQARFGDLHPDEQETHPSLKE
jgi:thioredoxin reductase (NADPH)